MQKIYIFMTEQGLKKEFFAVVFQKLALLLLFAVFAVLSRWPVMPVITFFVFSAYHNFYTNKALYELKAKYKHSDLSPEAALDAYSTELCFIHEENTIFRYAWFAAAVLLVLSLAFDQVAITVFVAGAHIALIAWEYHMSEYYNEST